MVDRHEKEQRYSKIVISRDKLTTRGPNTTQDQDWKIRPSEVPTERKYRIHHYWKLEVYYCPCSALSRSDRWQGKSLRDLRDREKGSVWRVLRTKNCIWSWVEQQPSHSSTSSGSTSSWVYLSSLKVNDYARHGSLVRTWGVWLVVHDLQPTPHHATPYPGRTWYLGLANLDLIF